MIPGELCLSEKNQAMLRREPCTIPKLFSGIFRGPPIMGPLAYTRAYTIPTTPIGNPWYGNSMGSSPLWVPESLESPLNCTMVMFRQYRGSVGRGSSFSLKHPGRLTFWTWKWRFGRWFSFSSRWFSGSMLIFQGVSIHDFLDISGGKKGNVEERTGKFVGYSEKSSSTSESSDSFFDLVWAIYSDLSRRVGYPKWWWK